jgi:hypothetical protein
MSSVRKPRFHKSALLFLACIFVSLYLAFHLPAQAGFQITDRLYPLPPGYTGVGYHAPLVSYQSGVFIAYYEYTYLGSDSLPNAQVFVSRVTPQGQVLDTLPIPISLWTIGGWDLDAGNVSWVGPPSDSAGFFMIWDFPEPDTMGGYRLKLMGNRLGLNGVLLDSLAIPLLTPNSEQTNYTCIRGDSLYLLLWEDARAGRSRFSTRASRIRGDRTALDPEGFHLNLTDTLYPRNGFQGNAVAYNGQVFLAVWVSETPSDYYHLWAARVREDGVVLDTVPIKLTPGSTSHSGTGADALAGSDGRDFFVAFRYRDSLSTRNYFSGVRITGSGTLLDTIPIRISNTSNFPTGWGMVFNGRDYQLVWSYNGWVVGARVSPQGVVKDTLLVPLFPTSPINQYVPGIALGADGKSLVAWHCSRWPSFTQIWGGFLDTTGREVGVEKLRGLPPGEFVEASLAQPLPNPLRNQGEIAFSLPASGKAHLSVYDALGRKTRVLLDEEVKAGSHRVRWDASDDWGRPLPSGVYFLRLEAGKTALTRKVVVIR